MAKNALRVLGVLSNALGGGRVHAPAAGLDVVRRDERVGLGMIPLGVDEPDGVEDLHRPMRVEARHDLSDRPQVAVGELAKPPVVVDRACA